MDTSFTNSRASIATARRADTDWTSLTTDQRIRSIELDGYVVIPDLLSAAQLEAIRDELVAMFLPAITIAGSLTLALGAEPVPDTFAGLAHEYEARTRAGVAYRRPLDEHEVEEYRGLYRELRSDQLSHEDSFRRTLAKVFVAAPFLYRFESVHDTKSSAPVSQWELASRLS